MGKKKESVSLLLHRRTSTQTRVKSEVFSAKAAQKRQARLPVGLPSATGWVGHWGSVWGSPQPVGAPRAGGCVGRGWAQRPKLGRSISDLNRAQVLGPRSWCWPGNAEGAAASGHSELTRHCCLTLLLQLSQGPSCPDFCFTFSYSGLRGDLFIFWFFVGFFLLVLFVAMQHFIEPWSDWRDLKDHFIQISSHG